MAIPSNREVGRPRVGRELAVGTPVDIWWPSLNRILHTCADLH